MERKFSKRLTLHPLWQWWRRGLLLLLLLIVPLPALTQPGAVQAARRQLTLPESNGAVHAKTPSTGWALTASATTASLVVANSVAAQTPIYLNVPPMNGQPCRGCAPAGWTRVQADPAIQYAVNGLSLVIIGYILSNLNGASASGGEMVTLSSNIIGSQPNDVIATTLTGLTVGQTYGVVVEWQQITLLGLFGYSGGQLFMNVDGNSTIYTANGGLSDSWQPAVKTFVATATTAVLKVGIVARGSRGFIAVDGGKATALVGPDTDADGLRDTVDLDDDNDGIPDSQEGNGLVDTDGDGVPDSLDLDSDNDGILDINESGRTAGADANGDGRLDGAISADGIPDSVQASANANTVTYTVIDTDGDSRPNFQDLDADNDGLNDVREAHGGIDANGDGQADGTVNANGVPSSVPPAGLLPYDNDGDGKRDWLDLDSDNDGINDVIEASAGAAPDTNGDGIVDGADSDGDGIKDLVDGKAGFGDANDPLPVDTDHDGAADYFDWDSDNDALTDLKESGGSLAIDANNDGKIDDASDPDKDGIAAPVDGLPAAYGDTNTPALPDDNGNGAPDYQDSAPLLDTDNDGIPDHIDLDDDNDGLLDTQEGNGLVDTDGDGKRDSRDLDSDNDGIYDCAENRGVDANGDGMVDGADPDGDGIPASADGAPATFGDPSHPLPLNSDNDPTPNYRDLDSDNDTIPDAFER